MFHIIRKTNLVLLAIVVLFGAHLAWTKTVSAQAPTAFLYRPYYGNFPGWTATFDHDLPLMLNDPNKTSFVRFTGEQQAPNCNSSLFCYNGHNGYDFWLAYQPVVASADGQVTFAGWDGPNRDQGLGLFVRIQHPNNHRTLYGHLSMVRYGAGTNVGRWQIGTSGTTGNSSGPHLHFEVHVLHNGAYRVTDPYGWNPNAGTDPWALRADGAPSYWLWVNNPLQTPPIRTDERVTDDDSSGHIRLCNPLPCPNWIGVSHPFGYLGDLDYTVSNQNTLHHYARFFPQSLPSTGQYEVEVYIPTWDSENRTEAARYTIYHQNGSTTVVVDQSRVGYRKNFNTGQVTYDEPGKWISLGRYNFSHTAPGQYVEITDATYVAQDDPGIYVEDDKRILVDAVRWVKTH